MLARFGPPALVAALLLATGVAFAVTERLKLELSPITRTKVTKFISPVCNCKSSEAWIVFSLRHPDTVTLSITKPNGETVKTLMNGISEPAGPVRAIWHGRNDLGQIVPDGGYRIDVHLPANRRTIRLPNVIVVDTTPPRVTQVKVSPSTFSPDADTHSDLTHIRFHLSERATPMIYIDGKLVIVSRIRARKVDWAGKINGHVAYGVHEIQVGAVDRVGNRAKLSAPVAVDVRILQVHPVRLRVKARAHFQVAVSTDRPDVIWHFAGIWGKVENGTIDLRAPAKPGRYRLVVRSGHFRARALVKVVRAG